MLSKVNNCYVVGELVEIKNKNEGSYTNKDGNPVEYVSADIVVKSVLDINGEKVEVTNELRNFTKKYRNDGAVNANYKDIVNIESLLNQKVVISGASLEGTRFWSARTNSLVQVQNITSDLSVKQSQQTLIQLHSDSVASFINH